MSLVVGRLSFVLPMSSTGRGVDGTKWLLSIGGLSGLAFALQLGAIEGYGLSDAARRASIVASAVLVVTVAVIAAHRVRFAAVIAVGAALNLAAIAVNGGAMPIDLDLAADLRPESQVIRHGAREVLEHSKDIPLPANEITFPWLADRFVLSVPVMGRNAFSLGDIVLAVGLVGAVLEVAAWWRRDQGINRRQRHPHPGAAPSQQQYYENTVASGSPGSDARIKPDDVGISSNSPRE